MSKKVLVFILISLFTVCSYAATVSDNDGAAFITKAEFDSLKNTFQNTLDQFNRNIDSKIDNAIATYLSSVINERKTNLEDKYKSINPIWMKNKRFNKSHLGTKYTAYISFSMMQMPPSSLTYNMLFLFEGTGDSWYRVSDMTYHEDDQEYLYRISKKDIGPFKNQWSLQDLIKSDYYVTVIGSVSGGRTSISYTEDPTSVLLNNETIFEKKTNLYFGTWFETLPIDIWTVDKTSGARIEYKGAISGSGGGESLAISAIATDVLEKDDTMFYLAGGELTKENMSCLNTADVSLLGDKFEIAKSNHGSSRHWMCPDDGSNAQQSIGLDWRDYGGYVNPSAMGPTIKAEVYRHKIATLSSIDILNEEITQKTKVKAYYYSGCPLFTATGNGEVKFKIKFTNTASAKTKWALSDKPFNNAANPGNAGSIEDCSETTFKANNNETVTISFKVKKDTIYWIKAEPESGYTTLEIDGDIVQTEKN